jgi:hypothetical protein
MVAVNISWLSGRKKIRQHTREGENLGLDIMNAAIVVIKMPELLHDEVISQRWETFLGEVNYLRRTSPDPIDRQAGVGRLAENVWQVDLQQNPAALARLVYFATEFGFPYGILPLDGVPQWLPGGFDPTPNEARSARPLRGR